MLAAKLIPYLKLRNSNLHLSSGLPIATASPSKRSTPKPTTPKPSCPKGLYVTWVSPNSVWMCCKNSDARGINDCKPGQAPFPYGPRRKPVCCQCPTGKVLNKAKNGCMSTEVPSSSPTVKPSLSAAYEPTPSPNAVPEPTPFAPPPQPAYPLSLSPIEVPTPSPAYEPTPQPTYLPTSAPSEAGTSDSTTKETECKAGYVTQGSYTPLLYGADSKFKVKSDPDFLACCKEVAPPGGMLGNGEKTIYIEQATPLGAKFQLNFCYCILGQKWYPETFVNNLSVGPYCGF